MTNAEARCNKSLRPRKPEGSLGRTAQDVHLDSHTAPELCTGLEPNRRVTATDSPAQTPSTGLRHHGPSFSGVTKSGRCRKAVLGVWLSPALRFQVSFSFSSVFLESVSLSSRPGRRESVRLTEIPRIDIDFTTPLFYVTSIITETESVTDCERAGSHQSLRWSE